MLSAPPIRTIRRRCPSTWSRLPAAGWIHISPAAAEYQVARVAKARGLEPARVRSIVAAHPGDRDLVVLGEPGVNVLEVNLALDAVR
jgi:hypothetical protein